MEIETIYRICAIGGGAFLVLRVVLMFFGIDHGDVPATDIHVDIGHAGPIDAGGHGGGYSFLSIQSIAGFFTMFGLVGLGLLEVNVSDLGSLFGGLVAGVVTAWCTGMIFIYMQKLQSEGTLVITNALGQTGTVYLRIPEDGCGVVNVAVQGTMRSFDAVSENGKPIPTGSIILVVGIQAEKILVVSEQSAETNHQLLL